MTPWGKFSSFPLWFPLSSAQILSPQQLKNKLREGRPVCVPTGDRQTACSWHLSGSMSALFPESGVKATGTSPERHPVSLVLGGRTPTPLLPTLPCSETNQPGRFRNCRADSDTSETHLTHTHTHTDTVTPCMCFTHPREPHVHTLIHTHTHTHTHIHLTHPRESLKQCTAVASPTSLGVRAAPRVLVRAGCP